MEVKPRIAFHVVNTIMLVLFFLAIAVQYNDDDGLVWMMIYGYAFVVTAIAYQRIAIILTSLGAVAYFIGAIVHFPEIHGTFMQTEAARESGGFFFCGIWMIVLSALWLRAWRTRAHVQQVGA